MEQNCNVCGEKFKTHASLLKKGWGLSCSKKCSAIAKGQRKTENYWQEIVNKYSINITLPKEMPKTVNEKFIVYCSLHGESETTITSLRDNKHGCPKCGMRTIVYKNESKQCRVCNRWMPLDQFCKTGKKLKSGEDKLEYRCKQCKTEAHKKYKETDNGRVVHNNAINKYINKKKQELLDQGKGPSCKVIACKCETCDKLFIKKGIVAKRFCSKECGIAAMNKSRKGIKLNIAIKTCRCKRCGTDYEGKKTSLCKTCSALNNAISRKASRKAHKKKRRAALRTVATEAVVDIKVFERDKWKCKICGIKLQKEFIYRDDAAEVDHIVPISLGGPHSYTNTQAACRKCNQEKSNQFKGQLVLCI